MLAKPPTISSWEPNSASLHQTQGASRLATRHRLSVRAESQFISLHPVREYWRGQRASLVHQKTRLIGAVLQEQHEEWGYGERRYFSDISMRKLVHTLHETVEPGRPELYLTA